MENKILLGYIIEWYNTRMNNKSSDAVYGFGVIGAAVYFIQNADSFGAGVMGILKALVWPAILVYKLFGM